MNNNFIRYIIFWLSQALSQLGSSMTAFALVLWAYTRSGSAMTVSLMSFFNYVPYIIVSLFAGAFVDNHSKKKIMLVSDSIAAFCSLVMLALSAADGLQIWHIYLINFTIGFMNAFQGPASSVAIGKIVPKEKLAQVSGMNSFSGNLVTVLTPVLSASLFALGGLKLILAIDLCSFVFAFLILLLVLRIPEDVQQKQARKSMFAGLAASLPIAFINAGQMLILYKYVPDKMQGRIFAVRNALQYSTIPAGILLGGFLADYVFEPFMRTEKPFAQMLHRIVGMGTGSGMAVMFLCTGLFGAIFSFISYHQKVIRNLDTE